MLKKAYILAGGKGTRLSEVVHDVPKPMAPINGFPFLHYILLQLKNQGIQEAVLLVGHLYHKIEDFFGSEYRGIKISYKIEETPRGTGGLIYELAKNSSEDILLINGDTFFDVNIPDFYASFLADDAQVSLALKEIHNKDRYGVVVCHNNRITAFNEKKMIEKGWINGGVYLLRKGVFDTLELPYSFSLETDFFEQQKETIKMSPYYSEGYFIDIGIPEDYYLAQKEIPQLFFPKIDSTWTLFLDRDGVINTHLPEDYVKELSEFVPIEGSIKAIAELSKRFQFTLVVTNQQGIGKGLMTEMELEKIHLHLQELVKKAGGRIDEVYYCPYLSSIKPRCRKPNPGMALQAKEEFPAIDFKKSIMVGDMPSDMDFAKNLGMYRVWVHRHEYNYFDKKTNFDLMIKRLDELPNFF